MRLAGINGGALGLAERREPMDHWIALPPFGSPYARSTASTSTPPGRGSCSISFRPANGTGVQPHRLAPYSYAEMSVGNAAPDRPEPAAPLRFPLDDYVNGDTGGGRPQWSPDGTQIAWDSPAGTLVSPRRSTAAPATPAAPRRAWRDLLEPFYHDALGPRPPAGGGGGDNTPLPARPSRGAGRLSGLPRQGRDRVRSPSPKSVKGTKKALGARPLQGQEGHVPGARSRFAASA